MDDILFIYKKYNRPGAQKLLQLARAEGIQATPKQIKEFLENRTEEQQLKETKNNKKSHGYIVSYNPFNRLQLDIFVLKKYESSNKGYGYILCIIDIFSRKVWCYPMKSKSLNDTTPAIKTFFSTSILSKEFLENKNTKWIDILPDIIERYNNTPHSSLDDITPNQAISDPKKRQHIMHLNILKARDNGFVTDLKPGDKVRIDDTALFKKGSESRWSDEIHVVKEATGKTVTLTDGTTHKRSKILMVPHNTLITTEKNVIKVATKQHKDKQYFKREDLDTANIIEGKRTRK